MKASSERRQGVPNAAGESAASPRLPAAVRRQRILELMRDEGYVNVARIAQLFGVSQMSARRDLDALSDEGRLVRSHGNAMPLAEAPEVPHAEASESKFRELQYDTRRRRQNAAKQAIARSAIALLKPEDNVALDVGTTVLALAQELARGPGLRVFTNHLRVAALLAGSRCEVLMPGGIVRAQELSLCGRTAESQIAQHWYSKAFIGVAGLTEEGGFDASIEDTQVKRAYIARAEQVILLCDASKFGQRSLARACTLQEIDVVISERAPPAALRRALDEAGVVVRIATRA